MHSMGTGNDAQRTGGLSVMFYFVSEKYIPIVTCGIKNDLKRKKLPCKRLEGV